MDYLFTPCVLVCCDLKRLGEAAAERAAKKAT